MSRNILVINVDFRESRVALIEDGVIAELQIERASHRGSVGNVVLGKVTRVLPGMQAAFIDIGMERAAFLHVEDLIRPDDFEAYLAGDARGEEEEGEPEAGQAASPVAQVTSELLADEPDTDEPATDEGEAEDDDDDETAPGDAAAGGDGGPTGVSSGNGSPAVDSEAEAATDLDEDVDDETELVAAPAAETAAVAEPSKTAPARKRRRRRRSKQKVDPVPTARPRPPQPPRRKDMRVSRSVPITEVVKEGDEVIVQVSKEPIGTKGARVTSHVSLPGRYVVYLPTVEHVGVSKRIGSLRERIRLRKAIESIKPPKGGLIVRTVAEGLTKKKLKADIGYLVKVWEEVARRREGARAPAILYTELDLVLKVARDLFTDEIAKVVIDDKEQFGRFTRFVEMFMPERVKDVELYTGDEPIFDAYGIEDEIGRALSRKVPLPSGGYLIIDQTEALTAIDVNTGRFVGKGSKDLEETAMKTNLEAVDEIAYQLRFRNIGGLVILDLIDMERPDNRHKVWRALEARLAKDKAKTTLNRISELGLIEMTRKRTRESLGRLLHEPCFYCDGTGQIQSRETIAFEILRQIRRERTELPGYSVVVNAHPAVVDFMMHEEKGALEEAERRFMRRIELHARPEYHIEQFDLQGR
jgi:ribonuclease G